MRKIGVFLGYNPEQSIRSEGLGRLLAFFIKGACSSDRYEVTVACPNWYRDELLHLLDDHNIPLEKLTILTTESEPYLLRVHKWVTRQKTGIRKVGRQGLRSRILNLRRSVWRNMLNAGLSSSIPEALPFLVKTTNRGIILLVIAISLFPLMLLRSIIRVLPRQITEKISVLRQNMRSLVAGTFRAHWMHGLLDELRQRELGRLVSKINAAPEIDGWLIPTLFWPECVGINARKVVVAPDIVFLDFPTHYADQNSVRFLTNAQKIAEKADHLITYSDYVKTAHIVRGLGIKASKISVVRHGAVSMADYLTLGGKHLPPDVQREVALDIVSKFQLTGPRDLAINRLDFQSEKVLFYSSQVRHHKNIPTLIRVVEELNRIQGINVRLLLTANLKFRPDIVKYIEANKLKNIVYSTHNVSSKVLAAMANLSAVAVTPTLFEGGFPFTFCEAHSVGTPSIISNIPVVNEVMCHLSEELQKRTLFDPYDVRDLSGKIRWALANREELHELQRELYDSYPNWNSVAGEYLRIVADEKKAF